MTVGMFMPAFLQTSLAFRMALLYDLPAAQPIRPVDLIFSSVNSRLTFLPSVSHQKLYCTALGKIGTVQLDL